MRGAPNRTQPGLVRARGRKRNNRALREEQLRGEAMQLGITVREHKQNQYEVVQELRRSPSRTPDWARPRGYREIVR